MRGKPWYTSKTLWFNALGTVVASVQYLSGVGIIPPPLGVPLLLVGNTILRLITTQPVTLGK